MTIKNPDESILEKQKVDLNSDIPLSHQVLRIAIYDEFKAYETYSKIIEKFGYETPFVNIKEAEARHYSMLIPLLEKYEVEIPQNDWADKIQVPKTLIECYELGVAGEIKNIQMYDELLLHTNEADIKDALYKLQAASYNNHLPAFRSAVAQYYANNTGNIQQEDLMKKFQEYQELFEEFSSGNIDESKITQLLSKINMPMVGGLVLGAVGAALVNNMIEKNQEKE